MPILLGVPKKWLAYMLRRVAKAGEMNLAASELWSFAIEDVVAKILLQRLKVK